MILDRYLSSHIHRSTLMVLLTLVSLSLFFTLVQQIDNLGKGDFSGWRFIEYLLLRIPGLAVQFMPLAVLIGSMLSLGALAANSELIAFQAAGVSQRRLARSISLAALVMAVLTWLVADFVTPLSETRAREIKTASIGKGGSLLSRSGLWVKEGQHVIFVGRLFPDGSAKQVEIHEFDEQDRLRMALKARSALPRNGGWLLQSVQQTLFEENRVSSRFHEQWLYRGGLSEELLSSLVIDPGRMSLLDLWGYMRFLRSNGIDTAVESLAFWRKFYAPLTLVVMALLALPFVSGSQRQGNAGQRLVIGILLGLVFVMLDKLLIQFGLQWHVPAVINALLPTALFAVLMAVLMRRSEQLH